MSNQRTIGKCSLCGGNVIVEVFDGIPSKPQCSLCGATKRTDNLPTIQMTHETMKETSEQLLLS